MTASAPNNNTSEPLQEKQSTFSYSTADAKHLKMNTDPVKYQKEESQHMGTQMMHSNSAFLPRMHQHLQHTDMHAVVSPPLTPSTSPAAFLQNNMHFKRKFSVDVGPFGFNSGHNASMIPAVNAVVQQEFYRRHSTCSDMSMDDYAHNTDQFSFITPTDMGHSHSMQGSLPSPPRVDHRSHFTQFNTHPSQQFYQENSHQFHPMQTQMQQPEHMHASQSKRKPTGNRHVCKYPYCGWSFKRYEHLKRHMLVHTGERPHICDYPGCGKSFSRSDNYAAHYRTHTRRAMLQRRMSGIASEYVPSDVSNNDMTAQNNDKFQPYATPEAYSMRENKSEQQSLHNPSSPQSPNTPSGLSHMIDYQQQHPSQHLYDTHTSSFNGMTRQFMLMEDPIPTDSFMEASPEKHSDAGSSHRMSSSSKSSAKMHICQVSHCQRKFKRLEHLKRHMRTHTLERPFTCTIPGCNKSFSRSDNLSQHIKTHQRREMRAYGGTMESTKPRFRDSNSPEHATRNHEDQNNVEMMNLNWHAGNVSSVGC
ncbi:hypothetical protein INT43_007990 [Umbelopsis isabellina]|uniref:C2H2-type domain-containing protein n=1 Tax=Mortierella isabellina TaxID=91625 RepID=A0A8H7PNP3_MORIS|nr:hypothetical protein INT43_007990 [Umbelopsis isabellina]